MQNHLAPQALFERLLLVIYAYGTRTGIRAAAAGDHDHSEDDLRYGRRRFLTVEGCREVARIIANATFSARHTALWGEGTTAVASDSTHSSAYDQNIFTEWHSRYRRAKRGVLIYWTVETSGAMADQRGLNPVFHTNMTPYRGDSAQPRQALGPQRHRHASAASRLVADRFPILPHSRAGLVGGCRDAWNGGSRCRGTNLRQANASGSLIRAGIGSEAWRRGLFRLR